MPMAKKARGLAGPDPLQPRHAGDVDSLPGGRIVFLAPLPLPTGEPALNEGAISELNDTWLDYGAGWPGIFGNQLILGGIFTSFLIMAYLLPMLVSPFISPRLSNAIFEEALRTATITASFALLISLYAITTTY